jgi:formamidopyrimidine-DNA glycosylase
VPELPEVESARAVIERAGLRRRIVDVDDSDTFVCRPHQPGEIKRALLGGELVSAMRRGKSMWCQTSVPTGRDGTAGPVTLGIHLGMSGKIVIADPGGTEIDGGDYWEGGRRPGDYRWARFTLTFEDGGRLMLVDPRRLGRVRLNPPVEALGPDAQRITPAQFRAAVTVGTAPVKAHLLDQDRIAGIGNLLADEILWRARIHPARPAGGLSPDEQSHLLRAMRDALRTALKDGGVHALEIIPFRHAGAACPRDDAPMASGTVGGRTSWWCSAEQRRAGLAPAAQRVSGSGQDGGSDRPGQVAQLSGHDGRSPRIRRLAVQGGGQGAGEQVEVLGGRAPQHHPVGPEQGQQGAEPGRHLLAVAFEGPRGAGVPGPGRGGRGGRVAPEQTFESGTGRRLFPAPGQAAVAGHGRVADGEVTALGMGAVPGPGQLAVGDDGDPDPGAEGDGDAGAAAAAGPVGVLPHRRGGRVVVDHAGPAGLLPDGLAQVHAGVSGQGGLVVDDAAGGDGPAGADPGRADAVTAGEAGQGGEQVLHRAAGLPHRGGHAGLADHLAAGVQDHQPGAGAAQVHAEGRGHNAVVILLP